VIKGETKHDEYINRSVSGALMQMGLFYKRPVVFGLLTPQTHEQAKDRAGGKHGNKGVRSSIQKCSSWMEALCLVSFQKAFGTD